MSALNLKPRHKWFSHTSQIADDGWSGPHNHIEDAARAVLLSWGSEGHTCYVAQGRKLTKKEIEGQGEDYTWEVDVENAIRIVIKE